MYLNGRWYGLTLKGGVPQTEDPTASLDVSLLQENLLDSILGIKDVRTDKRIDLVGGIRGRRNWKDWSTRAKAAVAFSSLPDER